MLHSLMFWVLFVGVGVGVGVGGGGMS